MNPWFQLVGGGILLYFAAEWFVGGASAIAVALRVPQMLIGLTVVAYGTSAPEVIVGIQAARAAHGDVALGNVIGSNIANIGLILGVAALIKPARVDGALRRRELPVLLASTAALPLLLFDGVISRFEAIALLLLALIYTAVMIRAAQNAAGEVASALHAAAVEVGVADAAGAPTQTSWMRAAGMAVVGLLALLLAGQLFVAAAVDVARSLGMSDRLVGLTIVAIGTSLPELVTSVVAARRGHSDIAVGNVVGSNIFNALLCLGAAGMVGVVGAPLSTIAFDLVVLCVITALAALFLRSERVVSRFEGGIVLVVYGIFTILTVLRE
jgi:cation:H+ antiporter